jgi:ketosteroid isomerase-like protein
MVGKELFDYVDGLLSAVGGIKSELTKVNARAWGDTGVVACVLEQDLSMHGMKHHISAPTTVVLRKEGAEWKIVHFHSAPLPE